MGLYKQKSGKVWWVFFSYRGRQYRQSTGATNKKLAESVHAKIKTQIVEGKFLEKSKEQDKTFEQLVDRYSEEVVPMKSLNTQRDDKSYAKILKLEFKGLYLDEITPDLISKKKHQWKSKIGGRTINRRLSFISAAFTQAIKVWGWCRFNPVSCIKREKENKRVKYFPDDEFEEIFEELADWVKPIVLVAKNTGLRRNNVVNLRWSQVDLDARFIVLDAEEMKNQQSLGVPLNEVAFNVLKDLVKSKKSQFIFCKANENPYTPSGVSAAFKKACVKANYSDYHFHDLRHDFCSKLVQRGVDLCKVKELAGHKDISSTLRYAHLRRKDLTDSIRVLDYSDSIIEDKKKDSP
ncbi:MAG: tyrosine-type recombinase/integrase [Nitrospinaceae bacterium]|nr:tyrosine-type recombinase/integrase [Nitrospinaceae bacterium]